MRAKLLPTVFLLLGFLSGNTLAQDHLNETFLGHYRKAAKTSIVRSKTTKEISNPKVYASVSELLDAIPTDKAMRNKYADLTGKNGPAKRKWEELRNVQVDCWIYATKWEGGATGDRDFHVIIGDEPGTPKRFMNAEISGLPVSGLNREALLSVRKDFLTLVQNENIGQSFNPPIDPPIKVKIFGSLFFDGDHKAGCTNGCPGPSWAKPKSVWEIHPIYSIEASP